VVLLTLVTLPGAAQPAPALIAAKVDPVLASTLLAAMLSVLLGSEAIKPAEVTPAQTATAVRLGFRFQVVVMVRSWFAVEVAAPAAMANAGMVLAEIVRLSAFVAVIGVVAVAGFVIWAKDAPTSIRATKVKYKDFFN